MLSYLGLDPGHGWPRRISQDGRGVRADPRNISRPSTIGNYLNAIPNGELCVINNWSGDYSVAKARAAEAGVEMNLAYFVPKTGAPAWFDVFCLPNDAANTDSAYRFSTTCCVPK